MMKRALILTLLLCAGALWAQPTAFWSPTEIDFGIVGLNEAAARTLFVMNGGTGTLIVDVSLTGNAFSLPPAVPLHFELQPRDSGMIVSVVFAPQQMTTYTGTLSLATNDPGHALITVPLTGTGGNTPPPPPDGFHLLQPANRALVTLPITFVWEALDNPACTATYTLYIASDSSNGPAEVAAFETGQDTQYTVAALTLPESDYYLWWVSALCGTERAVSEEVWTFLTHDIPPPPPQPEFSLLSPANNDTLPVTSVVFSWEGLDQAGATYTLWVIMPDSNRFDMSDFYAGSQTSLEVSPDDLDGAGSYLWYVVASVPGNGYIQSNETWRVVLLQGGSPYKSLAVEPHPIIPLRADVSVYPNPFNSQTCITLSLAAETQVEIAVFDLLGREIARLADERMSAGQHRVFWKANGPTGTYLLRVSALGEKATVQRLMFIK